MGGKIKDEKGASRNLMSLASSTLLSVQSPMENERGPHLESSVEHLGIISRIINSRSSPYELSNIRRNGNHVQISVHVDTRKRGGGRDYVGLVVSSLSHLTDLIH